MTRGKEFDTGRRGEIVSRFKVFWNKPLTGRKLIVLQFPDRARDNPYNIANGLAPLQLRIKPKSGFVEVDIPIKRRGPKEVNQANAIQYGTALKKSKLIKEGGTYGLAGGFNRNVSQSRSRRDEQEEAEEDSNEVIPDFQVAEENGLVLQKLTFGGRIQSLRDGDPIHAIGTFTDYNELYLTRIHAICTLQPQFNYLDAAADNDKSQGHNARGADEPVEDPEPKPFGMSLNSLDEEELDMSGTSKTLRALQDEQWRSFGWVDEDNDDAYKSFGENLFLKNSKRHARLLSLNPAMTPWHYLDFVSAPKIEPSVLGEKRLKAGPQKSRLIDILAEFSDDEQEEPAFVVGEREDEVMVEEGLRRETAID